MYVEGGERSEVYSENEVTTSAAVIAGVFIMLIILRLVIACCCQSDVTSHRNPSVYIVRDRRDSIENHRPPDAPPTYEEALSDTSTTLTQPLEPGLNPPPDWVAPAPLVPFHPQEIRNQSRSNLSMATT